MHSNYSIFKLPIQLNQVFPKHKMKNQRKYLSHIFKIFRRFFFANGSIKIGFPFEHNLDFGSFVRDEVVLLSLHVLFRYNFNYQSVKFFFCATSKFYRYWDSGVFIYRNFSTISNGELFHYLSLFSFALFEFSLFLE